MVYAGSSVSTHTGKLRHLRRGIKDQDLSELESENIMCVYVSVCRCVCIFKLVLPHLETRTKI